jgi:hypothetical protein
MPVIKSPTGTSRVDALFKAPSQSHFFFSNRYDASLSLERNSHAFVGVQQHS